MYIFALGMKHFSIPTKVGIQNCLRLLDSGFRRNGRTFLFDYKKPWITPFYFETISNSDKMIETDFYPTTGFQTPYPETLWSFEF